MAEEKPRGEDLGRAASYSKEIVPRVNPRFQLTEDRVSVEFRIEDLMRRVIPSVAGHCGGCYGCSGCSM